MFSLVEAAEQIRNRKLSSLELTRSCLARIEKLDSRLNSFITVAVELALEQAKQADAEIATGNLRGSLHGIPVALKDLIDVAGIRTTAASNQLRDNVAPKDAAIVTRLKNAGAVILGKTNLHEFAFGGSGLISAFGPARNPWDTSRITGGSSSGAAAAVLAGMCIAAMGTDTAGSIRDPAALCGTVGHRPSAGLWSMDGIVPLRKSFDAAGPITRTVEDAWLMLSELSTGRAATSLDGPIDRVRVGVAREGFFDEAEADFAKCVEQAIGVIQPQVVSVSDVKVEVKLPWTDFDVEILEVHRHMMESSPELYQPSTLERLRACGAIPAAEFAEARNHLAQARADAEKLFDIVDLVLTPTCLVSAPKIAELQAMTVADLRAYEVRKLLGNTAPFSLLFWPSVSVPCGFTSEGLPVGLQISGRPGADELVLRLARAYEQATEWHKRLPALAS